MIAVLLDSAARSLLMGLVVWGFLKILRWGDTGTLTAIWTAVLVAALAMPLLRGHAPAWVLTLPHVTAAAPAATLVELVDPLGGSTSGAGGSSGAALGWLHRGGPFFLWTAYLMGFSICALRTAAGLLMSVRLYRRAVPVEASWVEARDIRVSAEIRSPVSLAGAILLPADHGDWSPAKRSAVLAHEAAHIARRDFFVQLAAMIHCAVFWFSPFAWWLKQKLAEIAETASDEAAVQSLNDPVLYAEILVEVSRRAQKAPLIVAMANSSFIEQRVDLILSEASPPSLSLPQRLVSLALLAVLAIAVAGAKTAGAPTRDPGSTATAGVVETAAVSAAASAPTEQSARISAQAAARGRPMPAVADGHPTHGSRRLREATSMAQHTSPNAVPNTDEPTYNPWALLELPYTPKSRYVPASTIVHAGKEFYVRSTEKPVADVSITYAMERQTR